MWLWLGERKGREEKTVKNGRSIATPPPGSFRTRYPNARLCASTNGATEDAVGDGTVPLWLLLGLLGLVLEEEDATQPSSDRFFGAAVSKRREKGYTAVVSYLSSIVIVPPTSVVVLVGARWDRRERLWCCSNDITWLES